MIFLQETHIYQQKDIEAINNEWQGRHYWAYGSYHSVGVGVLFSPNFPATIEETQIRSDYEGRILYVPIKLEDPNIQLLNVHAPNIPKEQKNFFDSLPEYIKGHTPFVLGGDWNCVENILLDKFGGDRVSDPSALASLRELLRGKKAVDIHWKLHPNDRSVTWFNPGKTIGCRLDCFCLTGYSYNITSCNPFFSILGPRLPGLALPGAGRGGPGAGILETKHGYTG